MQYNPVNSNAIQSFFVHPMDVIVKQKFMIDSFQEQKSETVRCLVEVSTQNAESLPITKTFRIGDEIGFDLHDVKVRGWCNGMTPKFLSI